MDASSELVHSLLPLFLTGTLGVSVLALGAIEGVAEATAAAVRVVSGTWSDRLRRRKPLVVAGYALATFAKPLFPLASSAVSVLAARVLDRVGKGIRGAPRDALVADLAPLELRGAAYGVRQALDSVGAFLGPLAALAILWRLGGGSEDLAPAMWGAVVPALACVVVLVLFVREPDRGDPTADRAAAGRPAIAWSAAKRLPGRLWLVVALGAAFTLGRFSEAFLVLRAHDAGLDVALAPLVLVVMNAGYALLAFPAGAASDRRDRRTLLQLGLAVLVGSNFVLAAAGGVWTALAGVALWGAHLALTQGLLARLVADAAPADLRGTAFGVFHLVQAAATLAASVLAGALWTRFGPPATFFCGGALAALTAAGVWAHGRRSAGPPGVPFA
jgi:MFS family permease